MTRDINKAIDEIVVDIKSLESGKLHPYLAKGGHECYIISYNDLAELKKDSKQ